MEAPAQLADVAQLGSSAPVTPNEVDADSQPQGRRDHEPCDVACDLGVALYQPDNERDHAHYAEDDHQHTEDGSFWGALSDRLVQRQGRRH